MKHYAVIAALWLALALAVGPLPARADSKELVVGLAASSSAQSLHAMWRPLLEDLGAALDMGVRCQFFDDYAGVIWALGAGNVQLAWLGNKAAMEAVDRVGGEVGLQVINAQGASGYHSHLIVPAASSLRSVDDVIASAAGLTFGNGDPNSTSGFLVPAYYIFALRGVDPARLFKRVTQANHEDNYLAVAQGRVDVATSNSADLERLQLRFPEHAGAVKVIWTSPLIPSDPLVWRADLPQADKEAIRTFLSGYGRPAAGKSAGRLEHERQVMAGLNWTGFKPSDNSQLAPIRKLELHRKRLAIQGNSALPEAERGAALQAIEAELRALENR